MSNEHTPGPWVSPWRIHRIEEAFEVFWYDGEEGVDSYTYVATARQHDNAKLIAAAPETKRQRDELLAALQALDEVCLENREQVDAAINNATKEEA